MLAGKIPQKTQCAIEISCLVPAYREQSPVKKSGSSLILVNFENELSSLFAEQGKIAFLSQPCRLTGL